MAKQTKYVYSFGGGKAEGTGQQRALLGGKGANLAEMAGHRSLRLPVPPGFTVTTEVCTYYYEHRRRYPKELQAQVATAVRKVERLMGKKFGDPKNPLLFSVRSGARSSMPGMMETILNAGLTTKTIPGLIEQSGGNERFVYDAYRRLITMYADVVMEKAAGVEPEEDRGIRRQLDELLEEKKRIRGVTDDTGLTAVDLQELCDAYKAKVVEVLGKPFPDDPEKQLWGGIGAVFASWNGKRAVSYRRIEDIPDEWGTAVNVQSMVFGNMGDNSATGVAFTRDPGNGENIFYGEYLVNAQGEDVVAGIRTPAPINAESKSEQNADATTLHELMPKVYRELNSFQKRLEKHYNDMQDIEFTIENGRLYMLQCRVGKRNGPAAVRMAVEMAKERLITSNEAIMRVSASQLDELLHPILDPEAERLTPPVATGLPAGPGGATGAIVFTADDAVREHESGKKVILVRDETNPEDVEGMRAAEAILTARGGMTSHAALVARGWGKCCVVGCSSLDIDVTAKTMHAGERLFREGEIISLNGSSGAVYAGEISMVDASEGNEMLNAFLRLCDKVRRLKVRANADTPDGARRARAFGAQGIGLFRTEHMFYGKNSDAPLEKLRKMIFSQSEEERRAALDELFPYVHNDIEATLETMDGLPVTIRLLDPPLHEFVPKRQIKLSQLASAIGISIEEAQKRADGLRESNPMMGHRGVRLGVTFSEITEMQARAVFEAAADLQTDGIKTFPEIMVPVVGIEGELAHQYEIIRRVHKDVCKARGIRKIPHQIGTMIEIPRAALHAASLAKHAEFFSFGTNDLTQLSFGFSRDDTGGFLPDYVASGILDADPFNTLDQSGVGELVKVGIERGRAERAKLKVGICGEHGGDPDSVIFCHRARMDYVSCSPFRVPIARLSAAQAVILEAAARKSGKKTRKKPAKKAAAKKPAKKAAAKKSAKKAAAKKSAKKAAAKKSAKKAAAKKSVKNRPGSAKPVRPTSRNGTGTKRATGKSKRKAVARS